MLHEAFETSTTTVYKHKLCSYTAVLCELLARIKQSLGPRARIPNSSMSRFPVLPASFRRDGFVVQQIEMRTLSVRNARSCQLHHKAGMCRRACVRQVDHLLSPKRVQLTVFGVVLAEAC